MAKREYLDDQKRSMLAKRFGEQDWMNPTKAPNITTDTFGKGWRWTFSKENGWYLKNKKDIGDVVRQNIINPVVQTLNNPIVRNVATGAATVLAGPQAGMLVNAGLKAQKDAKLGEYVKQKFNKAVDRDSLMPGEPDYDLNRVLLRGGESFGRNYIADKMPQASKQILDMPFVTKEPGQVAGQQAQGAVNSKGGFKYDPKNRDPFAARKYYKDAPIGGGDNRSGNPQTLFKPYGHNTGKAVVVTGSHLAPQAVSLYDAKTKKLIARANKPRSIANGNRANWDLGIPGHMIKDAVIVFEGTGRSMYIKDGSARWKSESI